MSGPVLRPASAGDTASERVLTGDAVAFLAELHTRFGSRRLALLRDRRTRAVPRAFLPDTASIRRGRRLAGAAASA